MSIDHSPPRDQSWGYRILNQKAKKEKEKNDQSLSEKHEGKSARRESNQNALPFVLSFMCVCIGKNFADFEHPFLATASSMPGRVMKGKEGEKNQFGNRTGKDELFSS